MYCKHIQVTHDRAVILGFVTLPPANMARPALSFPFCHYVYSFPVTEWMDKYDKPKYNSNHESHWNNNIKKRCVNNRNSIHSLFLTAANHNM